MSSLVLLFELDGRDAVRDWLALEAACGNIAQDHRIIPRLQEELRTLDVEMDHATEQLIEAIFKQHDAPAVLAGASRVSGACPPGLCPPRAISSSVRHVPHTHHHTTQEVMHSGSASRVVLGPASSHWRSDDQ